MDAKSESSPLHHTILSWVQLVLGAEEGFGQASGGSWFLGQELPLRTFLPRS